MSDLKPPAELDYLTNVIGADAVLALIEAQGGIRTYVPKTPRADCPLVAAIGMEAAILLSAAFGGENINVPICRYWRVKIYRKAGLSVSQIARKLGVVEGTIYRQMQTASPFVQLDLFDPPA